MSTRLIQDLHAGISRRDWNAVEMAANSLRDDIEETRRILAGTGISSLPNDYPLSRLATEAKKYGGQEVEAVTMKRPADLARTENGYIINGHYIYALEVAISTLNLKIGTLRPQPASTSLVERLNEPLRERAAENLSAALEGELDGLCVEMDKARNIVDFVFSEIFRAFPQSTEATGLMVAFERDYPELYWHVAKGKVSAGEPLYGAIITLAGGTEIGHGESDVSAESAFQVAFEDSGLPVPPSYSTPSRAEVRHALETLNRANGADLDQWTDGNLPSDEITEALRALSSSQSTSRKNAE